MTRQLPAFADLTALVAEILSGPLRQVDTTRWSREDIRLAFINADQHLLLVSSLDPDRFAPEQRDRGVAAMKRIRSSAKDCRHKGKALLFWRALPLAKARLDGYRKAIAKSYDAMLEAGSVLVSLEDPELVKVYRTRCAR